MLPKIYVINMKSSVERADKIKLRLDALGLPFEFFDAVRGADLDYKNAPYYDRKRRLRYFGRDLLAGEIGCLLSHRGVYEKMLQDDVEIALVLEDDVTLDDDIKALLERIMAHNKKWDLLRFLGNKKPFSKGFRVLGALDDTHNFVRIPTVPGGAYGYMLTKHTAKVLVRQTEKSCFPIDTIHGRVWDTGLDVQALHPSPIYVDQSQGTTIGDQRFDKTLQIKGLQKVFYPAFRAWFKFREGVDKRGAYKSRAQKDKGSV
jgi:glycosyl transferase family 25